ncbi:hypothetical protein N9R65_03480 [Opitutales bacterium]|nr:hypothetical protein [Opitutales bacterium]MDB2681736.1 hypothetical protein [Opitutales bacterium]
MMLVRGLIVCVLTLPYWSVAATQSVSVIDAGGQGSSSAKYTNTASFGAIGGFSGDSASAVYYQSGLMSMLNATSGFAVGPEDGAVIEQANVQLEASAVLEDGTRSLTDPGDVDWSIAAGSATSAGGPLAAISTTGILTADAVDVHMEAVVEATHLDQDYSLTITVLDWQGDSFGSYAGDGLSDAWQVSYFGINSSAAMAASDPDQDGQDNAFEYLAGADPTDANSRFQAWMSSGDQGLELSFSPFIESRTYRILHAADLTNSSWQSLESVQVTATGDAPEIKRGRVADISSGIAAAGFYKVEIME